jgi:PPK2 family polyphosphate:nucleotide phosphotransferase
MHLTPVDPSHVPELTDAEAAPPDGVPRGDALAAATAALSERLGAAQALLTAEGTRAVLVVLQGRDASGKDGVVRHVFSACNPLGLRVTAFAAPSSAERAHDYLWRVHAACPPRGAVGIFNRSHYEDVLAVRVRGLAPEAVWSRRFRHIAEFERMLADEGTTVLKFFLHVSRAEQAERLRARLDEPDKNWKFDAGDLDDRMRWGAYTAAYRDVLARTGAGHAPWYVVPADKKKVRNYLVAEVLVEALERMAPRAPALPPEHLEAHRAALDAQLAGEALAAGDGHKRTG